MIGEIIAIGNELTSGRVCNTTSRFAARLLYGAGHEIAFMSTVGDAPSDIATSLRRAVKRSEFVIVTGGLGATSDDLTNEAAGKALGSPAAFHPGVNSPPRRQNGRLSPGARIQAAFFSSRCSP